MDLLKDGVHIETENDRPTGIAYASFATEAAATKALKKDGQYIGSRYVRLKRATGTFIAQACAQDANT